MSTWAVLLLSHVLLSPTAIPIGSRLNGAVVQLLDAQGNVVHNFAAITGAEDGEVFNFNLATAVTATQVRIDGAANQTLQLAEIDVFGFIV